MASLHRYDPRADRLAAWISSFPEMPAPLPARVSPSDRAEVAALIEAAPGRYAVPWGLAHMRLRHDWSQAMKTTTLQMTCNSSCQSGFFPAQAVHRTAAAR